MKVRHLVIGILCLLSASVSAQKTRPYRVEFGVQAGCGYYVGDATAHIFNSVREVYGAHMRYKFDPRWSLQVKGLHHVIQGPIMVVERDGVVDDKGNDAQMVKVGDWRNKMINLDVMAEFNFFRFGINEYDRRMKPITPYIFAGIGVGLYSRNYLTAAAYFPFGFGLKWKFAQRWGLNLAWQHNLYFADNLEGNDNWGDTWNLNGSNFLNFDLTGQLTLGIVFEFAQEKKICKWCYDN